MRQWTPAGHGAEACHARSPTETMRSPQVARQARRADGQAPVKNEVLPKIHDLVPTAMNGVLCEESNGVQDAREAGTRYCASSRPARWQRGGQRVQRRKRAAASAEIRTGGFWTLTPPFAHTDTSYDVSRESSQRDGYINPRFGRSSWAKERAFPLVEKVGIDGALISYSKNCFA